MISCCQRQQPAQFHHQEQPLHLPAPSLLQCSRSSICSDITSHTITACLPSDSMHVLPGVLLQHSTPFECQSRGKGSTGAWGWGPGEALTWVRLRSTRSSTRSSIELGVRIWGVKHLGLGLGARRSAHLGEAEVWGSAVKLGSHPECWIQVKL
jgi:hypothetical protein